MRTRIGRLAGIALASAALGTAFAAPASAAAPQFLVEVDCESLGAPVTVVIVGGAGIQRVIGELAQSCDRGTMRVSLERL